MQVAAEVEFTQRERQELVELVEAQAHPLHVKLTETLELPTQAEQVQELAAVDHHFTQVAMAVQEL
jgi:hypothetical protein